MEWQNARAESDSVTRLAYQSNTRYRWSLTLDNYYATFDYLTKFSADEKAMTRFIIGTISGIDVPMTPSQKGNNAVINYFSKRTLINIQKDRDDILATKAADITAFAKMVKDVLDQKAICVYGNKDKITAEKDGFKTMINLDQK
jgi:presequence protease